MARKMLVMEDSLLTNDDEEGGGRYTGILSDCDTAAIEDPEDLAAIEDPEDPLIETREQEDDDEQCSLALEALLKEVNVGEESYKTPTKGKSSVAISIEIEECENVKVSLPPLAVGMVFESWQKIDTYFKNYREQEGFGVVRSSGATKGKDENAKEKLNITWTCECFGLPGRKSKKSDSTFVSDSQISDEVCVKRKSKKVSCPMKLYAKINEVGEWVIDKALVEHQGHKPTPGKSKNITKFKQKFLMDNPHIVQQLLNDRKAGVPGNCDGVQEDVPVKDPPLLKRPAHRTTDSRYLILKSFQNMVPYRPQCVGGIQMLDGEGSIGYFTSVGDGAQQSYGFQISPQHGFYFRILNFLKIRFLMGCMDGTRLIHLYQLHQDKQGKFPYYLDLGCL
uniref:FAR1 domain-containing protein n=1 Tax=Chenopodium quinoa TaxID=63459 RepID=A0A803MSS3_CHEQI